MSGRLVPESVQAVVRRTLSIVAEIFGNHPGAVVVGGSVPFLLIPQANDPHEGTVDIDMVLSRDFEGADPVLSIHEQLERQLFLQDLNRPFRYAKTERIGESVQTIVLELLSGGPGRSGELARVAGEDLYLSTIPGLEIALENPLEAEIPTGSGQKIRVASLPAFLAMKTTALANRLEPRSAKDAYDIVYCLRNAPNGIENLARETAVMLPNPLIEQALGRLKEQFGTLESLGPVAYSQYGVDDEEIGILAREARERVSDYLAFVERCIADRWAPD